jgi:small nuclear ribonucleoprotein (snRNP)-like protein
MRKIACLSLALVFAVLIAVGLVAATKTYQFTGTVKSVDGNTFTVEKSAKETWTFETGSDTKGAPKVGDKVTVHYKMVATDIESKAAAPEAKPKAAPKKKK